MIGWVSWGLAEAYTLSSCEQVGQGPNTLDMMVGVLSKNENLGVFSVQLSKF